MEFKDSIYYQISLTVPCSFNISNLDCLGVLRSYAGEVFFSSESYHSLFRCCFTCSVCGNTTYKSQTLYEYSEPVICFTLGCENHKVWLIKVAESGYFTSSLVLLSEKNSEVDIGSIKSLK